MRLTNILIVLSPRDTSQGKSTTKSFLEQIDLVSVSGFRTTASRDEKDEMRAHIDDQLQRLQDITHMLEPGSKYTISKVSIGLNRIFRRVQVAEQSPEDKTGIASDTTH